jgi:hypothetical protein
MGFVMVFAGFVLVLVVIAVVVSRGSYTAGKRRWAGSSDSSGDTTYMATFPNGSSNKHHSQDGYDGSSFDSGGDGGGDGGGGD